jgi:hypothetical protein
VTVTAFGIIILLLFFFTLDCVYYTGRRHGYRERDNEDVVVNDQFAVLEEIEEGGAEGVVAADAVGVQLPGLQGQSVGLAGGFRCCCTGSSSTSCGGTTGLSNSFVGSGARPKTTFTVGSSTSSTEDELANLDTKVSVHSVLAASCQPPKLLWYWTMLVRMFNTYSRNCKSMFGGRVRRSNTGISVSGASKFVDIQDTCISCPRV